MGRFSTLWIPPIAGRDHQAEQLQLGAVVAGGPVRRGVSPQAVEKGLELRVDHGPGGGRPGKGGR